jgi:F0F1-type ATP synthase membrane subunit c/vacuolar-type H+-ATPase subunit K
MFRIKSQQDFGAAVMLILFGLVGLWFGREYPVGTASQMGPGYMPMALSWALIIFGVVLGLRAVALRGPGIESVRLRSNILVLGAILGFALLIQSAGLAISIFVVTVLSALASTESRWKETIALGLFLTVFCVLVFIYGLRQSMPVFGSR